MSKANPVIFMFDKFKEMEGDQNHKKYDPECNSPLCA